MFKKVQMDVKPSDIIWNNIGGPMINTNSLIKHLKQIDSNLVAVSYDVSSFGEGYIVTFNVWDTGQDSENSPQSNPSVVSPAVGD